MADKASVWDAIGARHDGDASKLFGRIHWEGDLHRERLDEIDGRA